MSHRSREAQALLDAARPDEDPSDADRARLRGAVFARIGAAAAASAITTTAAQAGAGAVTAGASAGLAGKVAIGLLVVAGLGGGAVAVGGVPRTAEVPARSAIAGWAREAAEPARTAAASPASAALAPTAEGVSTAASADVAAGEKAAAPPPGETGAGEKAIAAGKPSAGAPDAMPGEVAAPTKRSELDAESALLRRAQTELSAGRTDEALRLLAEHERSFSDGALREERAAGRVLALCQAGKAAEARALAEQFLRDNPSSPLAARVRGACAQK
jgi:hypothetical protein